MNYVELIRHQAERVFDNKERADKWLNQPKSIFFGNSPLQIAHSAAEYEIVKAELDRISHGFSL